jgi:predicted metal-dependent peptidase
MASSDKTKEYVRRIMIARMRLLCDNGFFGLLLMHTKMGLSEKYPTCYNNGSCIFFNPDFLDRINDDELKYVLMHEVMHIVLHHLERGRELIEDEK